MSDNKSSQNAHEERVFNDVIQLSLASGGYKKKLQRSCEAFSAQTKSALIS